MVFIAINSGADPETVKKYARSQKVNWPVIIDTDRTLESRMKVKEVSLQNIWQFRSIDAAGKIQSFNGKKMAATAESLLKDAKWEIDAELIPESLSQAHSQVEFGCYANAAKTLVEASKSRDESIKAGADALLGYVKKQSNAKLKVAEEARTDDQLWPAYKLYSSIGKQFRGYELDVDLVTIIKELKADDAVKAQVTALRLFESAKKQFPRNGKKKTLVKLNRIVKKYPDTEGAVMAADAIDAL